MTASKIRNTTRQVAMVGPYPPVIGGTAAMLAHLVPALGKAGVECRVINSKVGDRQGGFIERLSRLFFFAGIGMKAAFESRKIVHCHAVNYANLLGNGIVLLVCRLTGKKTVLTLHAGDLQAKLSVGRSRRVGRRILCWANVVTTVTPELARLCGELGVANAVFIPNDLRYVPHGGDGTALPDEVASFIAGHDPVVSLVGAMNPPYGIDVFLRALDVARKDLPRLGGLVVAFKSNDMTYGTSVAELKNTLGLQESVMIPDSFANVAEALRRSDIFVRPTRSDGDSIAVREALGLGLPVIASDTGFRPGGVVVFPVGDHKALADRIVEVASKDGSQTAYDLGDEQETIASFLAAYDTAAGI